MHEVETQVFMVSFDSGWSQVFSERVPDIVRGSGARWWISNKV